MRRAISASSMIRGELFDSDLSVSFQTLMMSFKDFWGGFRAFMKTFVRANVAFGEVICDAARLEKGRYASTAKES